MKIKHLMHRGDCFVTPDQTLADAIGHYVESESNCVPVISPDNNKPLGILTIYRVLEALRTGKTIDDSIEKVYVRDIQSVNQEVPFEKVRDLPLERLLVLDDEDRLVGVLSKIELVNRIFNAFDLTANELNTILMTVPIGIVALDGNGVVTEINEAATDLLGVDSAGVFGMDMGNLLQGELESADVEHGMTPRKVVVRGRRCIAQARPIIQEGATKGVVIAFQDISEIESLAQELNTVTTLFNEMDAIVSSLSDGLLVLGRKREIVYANENMREMFSDIFALMEGGRPDTDIEHNLARTIRELSAGETTATKRVLTGEDGNEIILKYSPVRDEEQRTVRHVLCFQDMTEMNRLRIESARQFEELQALRRERFEEGGLIFRSPAMADVIRQVRKVARVESTTLILGESGVGKSEVAKHIHAVGTRTKQPFLTLNCGAIPENLIESELFGYERGAFTGADKTKIGLLEVANNGCLFLDEIAELPLHSQVKLLHFLQESEIVRVGGSRPIRVDVRVISATNKDLYDLVELGLFRKDLYYRLNVVPIPIPPLRERKEDILPLAYHTLERLNAKHGQAKRLCPETCGLLERYEWPGNVRELINVLERMLILSDDDILTPSALPAYFNYRQDQGDTCHDGANNLKDALSNLEQSMIKCALRKHGSLRPASKELGISHPTLLRKIRKYGITVQE